MSNQVPFLPLRDIVVFPETVANIFVGREQSIKALDAALDGNKKIILVPQLKPDIENIDISNLYQTATLGIIVNRIDLPDKTIKILVKGLHRIKLKDFEKINDVWYSKYDILTENSIKTQGTIENCTHMIAALKKYLSMTSRLQSDTFNNISIKKPSYSADLIVANLPLSVLEKMNLLAECNVQTRCKKVYLIIQSIIENSFIEKNITDKVKKNIDKSHREFYLNEKIKVIQQELGNDESVDDMQIQKKAIEEAQLSTEAREKAQTEFKKLSQMPVQSPESSVIRNYLDILLKLPWEQRSKLEPNLNNAEKTLNKDHYGLEEVKERILENLAVHQRTKKTNGTILCLVGPSGVGKTSLAESIAKATGRKYIRMALGGVKDESEIRGHRRTYIGSMPGKIIQKISQSKVKNPLFLLDEIDKMAMDFRGDPASALLEVLDPEQNHSFNDHYLEVDFDLSEVMFLATSNSYQIPAPLLDRMDIIELEGYTEIEKKHIAKHYLFPKQKEKNGIKSNEIRLLPSSIPSIIQRYTKESGVRSLERQLAKVCRKTVRLAQTKSKELPITLDEKRITEFLGVPPFQHNLAGKKNKIGQITGLAWSQMGGSILSIETITYPGSGKLTTTGKLGEVIQESIKTALSVVRSCHQELGIDIQLFTKNDLHVHIPEGATPKDGPSAGVAIACALASQFSKNPARSDIAMTGEVTLSGEVLPIGGLKQKLLAAKRSNIKTVLIPEDNNRHLADFSPEITADLEIISIKKIDEAFNHSLTNPLISVASIKKNSDFLNTNGAQVTH